MPTFEIIQTNGSYKDNGKSKKGSCFFVKVSDGHAVWITFGNIKSKHQCEEYIKEVKGLDWSVEDGKFSVYTRNIALSIFLEMVG